MQSLTAFCIKRSKALYDGLASPSYKALESHPTKGLAINHAKGC